ncbi:hypothetical protein V2J09_008708 [Rumex salicifolius]
MAASTVDQIPKLTLYSYWRSSCSFRVRIALNFKGLNYEYKAVNLLIDEQNNPEFKKLNPTGFVPLLVDGDVVIGDSLAIILYLEDKYPQTPLLPLDLKKKAVSYQAATIVSSGIQPFQNLSMLKFIEEKVGPDQKLPWAQYHIKKGFAALEDVLKGHAGRYAIGDEVSLFIIDALSMQADIFLAPQIDGAVKRFSVDMDEYPLLKRLNDAYNETPAFIDAMPDNQPDAPQNLK